jgi:transcriptional regulator with XRE-family HTH domain
MPQPVTLTSSEEAAVLLLGRRIKAARLRRNISQEAMARRAGVTRKTFADLEAGKPTVGFSVVVKTMMIFGYLERIGGLLASDPIGEEIGTDRKRSGRRDGIADF